MAPAASSNKVATLSAELSWNAKGMTKSRQRPGVRRPSAALYGLSSAMTHEAAEDRRTPKPLGKSSASYLRHLMLHARAVNRIPIQFHANARLLWHVRDAVFVDWIFILHGKAK